MDETPYRWPVTSVAKWYCRNNDPLIALSDMMMYGDGINTLEEGNISAGTGYLGLATDYLFRFMKDTSKNTYAKAMHAFNISWLGAMNAYCCEDATEVMINISGLDDESIQAACRLVTLDDAYRKREKVEYAKRMFYESEDADKQTCNMIRTMVERCLDHYEGEDVILGPTFEGAYTDIVGKGDADLMSAYKMSDIKTSTRPPTKEALMQVGMYMVMSWHSPSVMHYRRSKGWTMEMLMAEGEIEIYNPRLDTSWTMHLSPLDDCFKKIEEIIGYDETVVDKINKALKKAKEAK